MQVPALLLTGHLIFSSVVLLSSSQHLGLDLFRNIHATYTVAMVTHDMATEGLTAFLLALGSAALKFMLCAGYREGNCAISLFWEGVGAFPVMPEFYQHGCSLALYLSAGEAGW